MNLLSLNTLRKSMLWVKKIIFIFLYIKKRSNGPEQVKTINIYAKIYQKPKAKYLAQSTGEYFHGGGVKFPWGGGSNFHGEGGQISNRFPPALKNWMSGANLHVYWIHHNICIIVKFTPACNIYRCMFFCYIYIYIVIV